jgi:hypothetical protein
MELNIKVDDFNTTDSFEPLPPGWYAATVETEADEVSKAGDPMLKLTYSVDGGRRVNAWYNTGHPTSKEYAYKDLTRLAGACGLVEVGPSSELVGRKCEIRLEIDGTYNSVKGYRSTPRSAPPAATGASSNGSARKNPWD